MISTLTTQLEDSLRILKQSYNVLNLQQQNSNYFNYFVGVAGVIGTLIGVYTLYQYLKSKKLQAFIYEQAKIALERESNEQKLSKTKQELSSVEARLRELQKQIQRDLPIEARKAVLKDRLDESIENLKKYYEDIKSTKAKLENLGVQPIIPDTLLKNIQIEIEPRYLIKEKIATYQTLLTIVSTLSGLAFAFLPYPFAKYVGGTFLLIGLPIIVMILQLTLIKRSKDKQKTNLIIKLGLSVLGTILTFFSAAFFWLIYFTIDRDQIKSDLIWIAVIFTFVTILGIVLNFRFYRRLKRTNTMVQR